MSVLPGNTAFVNASPAQGSQMPSMLSTALLPDPQGQRAEGVSSSGPGVEQVLSWEGALMEADSWEGYRAALSWAVDNVCPLTPIGRRGRAVEWRPPRPPAVGPGAGTKELHQGGSPDAEERQGRCGNEHGKQDREDFALGRREAGIVEGKRGS